MKKWEKPQLIILTRSKTEEAVLQACKASPEDGDPFNNHLSCQRMLLSCVDCSELVGS